MEQYVYVLLTYYRGLVYEKLNVHYFDDEKQRACDSLLTDLTLCNEILNDDTFSDYCNSTNGILNDDKYKCGFLIDFCLLLRQCKCLRKDIEKKLVEVYKHKIDNLGR